MRVGRRICLAGVLVWSSKDVDRGMTVVEGKSWRVVLV